jgi:hypothetical protein
LKRVFGLSSHLEHPGCSERVTKPRSREESMKKQVLAAMGVGVLALALVGTFAWAAGSAVVNIPFDFIVKDREMPAGRYQITPDDPDQTRLLIQRIGGTERLVVPVMTRLADTGTAEVRVVFDQVGEKDYLSEVHFPGEDGFALQGAPGKHTHRVLSSKTQD